MAKGRALEVIATTAASTDGDDTWWIGTDARGIEIEVLGRQVMHDGEPLMLIIHVMPTALRRK